MNVKISISLLSMLILFSCVKENKLTLQDTWRLVNVNRLNYPPHGSILDYPSEPRISNSPYISKDTDYQTFSWTDSLRVECKIIFNNSIVSKISTEPYQLINDTMYFQNSRYKYDINGTSLFLSGYSVYNNQKLNFLYHLELE
jgi:hypothetical protein